jgi:hypothetical protein
LAIYKGIWIFNAGKEGWSETWYLESTTISQAMATMRGPVLARRTGLLGTGAYVEAVKVQDFTLGRVGLLASFLAPTPPTTDALMRDTSWNTIYVRVQAGAYYFRQLQLRGVRDDWITPGPDNEDLIAIPVRTGVENFINAAKRADLRVRVLRRGTDGNLAKPITGLDFSMLGFLTFHCPAHGLLAGQYVTIRGIKGLNVRNTGGYSNVNGVWQVNGVAADTFSVPALHTDFPADPVRLSGGTMSTRDTAYVPIVGAEIVRFSRRMPGRAFFVQRGRRRARPRS